MLAGSGAAVISIALFRHIKVRIYNTERSVCNLSGAGGFQVAQSLFAIGTGGWLGMGLCQGSPESIPVAAEDFIFSAIVEELGLIFGLCLILVCVSCYIMFLNIAMCTVPVNS
ncbi:MAG: FtsW/RodA/SpoVE family cell cycle protein [Faecalimonas sp.]